MLEVANKLESTGEIAKGSQVQEGIGHRSKVKIDNEKTHALIEKGSN